MPARILSPSDWQFVVDAIARAQHLLTALPRAPELDEPLARQVAELAEALRRLGFDPGRDQLQGQFFESRDPPLG